MRTAVISKQGLGKTTFVSLLAQVFALTQKKSVCIMSTGDGQFYREYNTCTKKSDAMQSTSILKVMGDSGIFRTTDIYNYAIHLGQGDVFLYNAYDASEREDDIHLLNMKLLSELPARFKLIEVNGDYRTARNREVLDACDTVIYLAEQSRSDAEDVKNYFQRNPEYRNKTKVVCTRFDDKVVSQKRLSGDMGLPSRDLVIVPYNSRIRSASYEGKLDTVAKAICKGDEGLVEMRPRFVSVMQWLFDSPGAKYIRDIRDWDV